MAQILRNREHRQGISQNIPDLVLSLPKATQTSCPLLTLPAEIRNHIYAFSLESEDISLENSPRALYHRNAFYYRPGYKQPKRIQTGLLQTCQQIYDEASLLPPGINEHTFWFYRPPPHVEDPSSPLHYFLKMTPRQRGQVDHVHFFTQQYFLEDGQWSEAWNGIQMGNEGCTLRGACRIAPRKLTITLRHSDWWYWENNDPLGIDPFRVGRTRAHQMGKRCLENNSTFGSYRQPWGSQFSSIPCLEELVFEFETIMRKRDQLDAIAQMALNWKFPMDPKQFLYLIAEPQSLTAYTWAGAKEGDLKEQRPAPPRPGNADQRSQESEEVLPAPSFKLFNPKSYPKGSNDETGQVSVLNGDTDEYYVVFLTWRKKRAEE